MNEESSFRQILKQTIQRQDALKSNSNGPNKTFASNTFEPWAVLLTHPKIHIKTPCRGRVYRGKVTQKKATPPPKKEALLDYNSLSDQEKRAFEQLNSLAPHTPLPPLFSLRVLKKTYRKLALLLHPDRQIPTPCPTQSQGSFPAKGGEGLQSGQHHGSNPGSDQDQSHRPSDESFCLATESYECLCRALLKKARESKG